MSTFKHYIITRFNIPKRWDADKSGRTVLDEQWLEQRYALFETYCFPSVQAQIAQDFEWWVFFDAATPEKKKRRNAALQADYPNFVPHYVADYDTFLSALPAQIKQATPTAEFDFVITTRLDNDDVIAKDFVASIQRASLEDHTIIEPLHGFTLSIDANPKLYFYTYPDNPFLSLIEQVSATQALQTIYHQDHGGWEGYHKVNQSEHPMWIQIIHEQNVFNTMKGTQVSGARLNSRFGFEVPTFDKAEERRLRKKQFKKRIKGLLGKK